MLLSMRLHSSELRSDGVCKGAGFAAYLFLEMDPERVRSLPIRSEILTEEQERMTGDPYAAV